MHRQSYIYMYRYTCNGFFLMMVYPGWLMPPYLISVYSPTVSDQDGTAAQFRPLALKESISQIYERGSLEHLPLGE